MKSLFTFSIVIAILLIGCSDAPATGQGYDNHQISQAIPVQNQTSDNENFNGQNNIVQESSAPNKSGDEITMHTVLNSQTGKPLLYIPFPSSWELIKGAQAGQPSVKGPHGLILTSFEPQGFIYTNDQNMNQTYQAYGQNVMPPVGIENVISQQVIPQGKQMGMTLINQYPLPEIAANNFAFAKKLSGGSPQDVYQAAGLDWTDQDGNKVFVVLHYNEMRSQTIINWGYTVEMIKVQPSNFEKAKSQYIYALSNKIFDEREINDHNAKLANKIKADNDNFQTNQEIIKKGAADRAKINSETTEYIRDLNKAANDFRQHNNDVVQEQMGNHLNDVNVVISPYDGKEYQVETGSKTYWINDKGQYFQSDDLFFDPNNYETQPGVWKKAPMKEYK